MPQRLPDPAVDAAAVSRLLRDVAVEVILPRHRSLGDGDIDEKDHGELVTVADIEAERWLDRNLTALLPGSCTVGEEAAYADASVFARFDDTAPVWVIDPIDGTSNFANGGPVFATIVALVQAGETIAGWIYEPISGTLAYGRRGAGVALDGQRIDLTGHGDRTRCSGVAARQFYERAERDESFIETVRRPNCAGHEYVQILRGEHCFSAYTRLKPWDHAAGSFLVREAGGHSALIGGGRYDVRRREGHLLSASDEISWRRLQAILADDNGGG